MRITASQKLLYLCVFVNLLHFSFIVLLHRPASVLLKAGKLLTSRPRSGTNELAMLSCVVVAELILFYSRCNSSPLLFFSCRVHSDQVLAEVAAKTNQLDDECKAKNEQLARRLATLKGNAAAKPAPPSDAQAAVGTNQTTYYWC